VTNVRPEGFFGPVPVPAEDKFVKEYKDIFIKVKPWGAFQGSDIELNGIHMHSTRAVPDFVANFERELDSKPGVAHDVRCFLHHIFDADRSM
jgi:hypothetical protein